MLVIVLLEQIRLLLCNQCGYTDGIPGSMDPPKLGIEDMDLCIVT